MIVFRILKILHQFKKKKERQPPAGNPNLPAGGDSEQVGRFFHIRTEFEEEQTDQSCGSDATKRLLGFCRMFETRTLLKTRRKIFTFPFQQQRRRHF